MSEQVMQTLREWLSREGCRLQDRTSSEGKLFQCRSFQRLKLMSFVVAGDELERLCNGFPNLKTLCLVDNNICDLSTLESILSKEDCPIQVLHLQLNLITFDSLMKFAFKIPKMKSLKRR